MNEEVMNFLQKDKIDPLKFKANFEIIQNETKELYKSRLSLFEDSVDMSEHITPTIEWMASIFNQPIGYPVWFMTAYPDVVKWMSNLTDDELILIIGDFTEESFDESNKFKINILRKIIDSYTEPFECC